MNHAQPIPCAGLLRFVGCPLPTTLGRQANNCKLIMSSCLNDSPELHDHRGVLWWLFALCLALAMSGCSSMLPKSNNASSSFAQFADLRNAVESLQPMKSDLAALRRLGIDPIALPNTLILSYADILRRFAIGTVVIQEQLDAGIATCLLARDGCRGWELQVSQVSRERNGNFLADFTKFKRRTETSGWRFNALILLADDVVVYRAWGGQPFLNQVDVEINPLGPLQDIAPAVVRSPF